MIVGIIYVLLSIGIFIAAWRDIASLGVNDTKFDDFMDFVVGLIIGLFWPAILAWCALIAPFYLVYVLLRPLVLGKRRDDSRY